MSRVVWMLEEAAQESPVILATHSNRLLDALEDPAGSVVLFELGEGRATRTSQPDAEQLQTWLADYYGIGSLREAGYESHVFKRVGVASEQTP